MAGKEYYSFAAEERKCKKEEVSYTSLAQSPFLRMVTYFSCLFQHFAGINNECQGPNLWRITDSGNPIPQVHGKFLQQQAGRFSSFASHNLLTALLRNFPYYLHVHTHTQHASAHLTNPSSLYHLSDKAVLLGKLSRLKLHMTERKFQNLFRQQKPK